MTKPNPPKAVTLSFSCCSEMRNHAFQPIGSPYRKDYRGGKRVGKGGSDEDYQVIFCTKCGLSKEILVREKEWRADNG